MPDRDKVIKELEKLQTWFKHLQTVGYHGDMPEYREREQTVSDALTLLLELEPVPPDTAGAPWWRCGNCGGDIVTEQFWFCPWCGKKVKWDA